MAAITDKTGANVADVDAQGRLSVTLSEATDPVVLSDGLANPATGLLGSPQMLFNDNTWDRARNNFNKVITADKTITASEASASFVNHNAKALMIFFKVAARSGSGTPTLTPKLQWTPDGGTTWLDLATATGITAVGTAVLLVGLGVTAAAGSAVNIPVPRDLRLYYGITGTTPSFTFSAIVAFCN